MHKISYDVKITHHTLKAEALTHRKLGGIAMGVFKKASIVHIHNNFASSKIRSPSVAVQLLLTK